MSFRSALPRAAVLRSAVAHPTASATRALAAAPANVRLYSDKPAPEAKANALLDLLPGNSLLSKTGWVTLGTGVSAVAISQELYVANEETVILAGFLIFATLVGRSVAAPYAEWADGAIAKIREVLNASRAEHTKAVQSRIDAVSQQQEVVEVTKSLFDVAKRTAQLESEAFELRQRTQLASELKSVLDSWARFEAQQREEEQRQLAKTVIEKVQASLRDEKTQKQILDNAVAEIEALVKSKTV